VTQLDLPSTPQYALSFDFDGTLHAPGYPLHLTLFDHLEGLRRKGDAVWGINTGRSLMQTLEGIGETRFPFLPDFIVAREREIYVPGKFGRWQPLENWNKRCEKDHGKLFRKGKKLLKQFRAYVETQSEAEWIEVKGDPAGIIAQSESEMGLLVEEINRHIDQIPSLSYQRNTVYLRFGHESYHKGSAFAELCRLWDIPVERRFAIGDGHNDFGMLDTSLVGMIATLQNAHDDIKQHVEKQGGYRTKEFVSKGTIEALEHYFAEFLGS